MKVDDSEVTVERYLSPEEKKRMEEAAQLEEERRMAEMADNWRKRALDMMMDGRLEANLEEDLFKVRNCTCGDLDTEIRSIDGMKL